MPQDNKELLFNLYRTNPSLFSQEEADQLQTSAREAGIKLVRDVREDDNYLVELPKQLVKGFTEGFSANLVEPFQGPRDETGKIAYELGHLAGFVGILFPGTSFASLGAKATLAAGGAIKTATGFAKVVRAGEAIERFAPVVGSLKSVPMAGADVAARMFGKSFAGKAAKEFLAGSPFIEQSLTGAAHLGVASGISSLHDGLDEAFSASIHGALFGGVFAGVGNIPLFAERTTANAVMKTIAGSALQGLPATYQGASTAGQVKEYLLGAYFGYHSMSKGEFKAAQYLQSLDEVGKRIGYEQSDEFLAMTPEQRADIKRAYDKLFKPQETLRVMYEFFERLGFEGAGDEAIKSAYTVGTGVRDPETGVRGTVVGHDFENRQVEVQTDTGIKRIDYGVVEGIPQGFAEEPTTEPLNATETVDKLKTARVDFESAQVPVSNRIKNFVETILGQSGLNSRDYQQQLLLVKERIDNIHAESQRDGTNGWETFVAKMEEIRAANPPPVEAAQREVDWGGIRQLYNEVKFSVPTNDGYISARGGLQTYRPAPGTDKILDIDNNRLTTKAVPDFLSKLHNDNELILNVNHVEGKMKGRKKAVSLQDVKLVHIGDKRENPDDTYVQWKDVWAAARAVDRYLYVNNGDKGEFKFIKYHSETVAQTDRIMGKMNEATKKREGGQLRDIMGDRFDIDYQKLIDQHVFKNELTTKEEFERQIVSNALYYEEMNSSELPTLLDPLYKKSIDDFTAAELRKMVKDLTPPSDTPETSSKLPRTFMTGQLVESGEKMSRLIRMNNADIEKLFRSKGLDQPKRDLRALTGIPHRHLKEMVESGEIKQAEMDAAIAVGRDIISEETAVKLKEQAAALTKDKRDQKTRDWDTLRAQREGADFLMTPLDFNKRQQPLFTDSMPVNPEMTGGLTHLNTVFMYDYSETGKKAFGRLLQKESSDGGTILRSDVYDNLANATGLPLNSGALKPFVISRDPQMGLLLRKEAFHRASPELSAEMEKHDIHVFAPTSSTKQAGRRQFVDIHWNDGKLSFTDKAQNAVTDVPKYAVPMEDHHISYGTYDNASRNLHHATTLVKQLMSSMTDAQSSPEARKAIGSYLATLAQGTPEAKGLLKDYLANPSPEGLAKLTKGETFEHVGLRDLLDAMRPDGNKDLREAARLYMQKNSVTGLDNDVAEIFSDDFNINGSSERLSAALEMLQYGDGKDAIALAKPTKKLMESMMTNFFIRRMTSPKVLEAQKGVLRPYDIDMQSRLHLTDDNFFLGDTFRDMPIKGIGEDGLIKDMTLGEQWDILEKIRGNAGEAVSEEKTVSERKRDTLIAQIEKKLTAVVLRVPMDDVSGAQSLRFAGFTGTKGGHVLISDENMKRLGGADYDIDSAFFYFGLPREVHDTLREHRNVQAEYAKHYPGAEKAYIRPPNDLPLQNSILGMLDPYHRAKIGNEVAKGRGKMMGVAVTNKFLINSFYDAVVRKGSGQPVEMLGSDGSTYIFTPRNDNSEMLRAMSSAALHVAADVGKHGGMIGGEEMRAILLHSAFERIERINPKGQKTNVTGNTIVNTNTGEVTVSKEMMEMAGKGLSNIKPYQALRELNSTLFGYNHGESRPYTHEEMVGAAQNFLDAAKDFPILEDHPMRGVAQRVSDMDLRNSNLQIFLPNLKEVEDITKNLNSFFYKAEEGVPMWEKLFPYLKGLHTPPWKETIQRMRVIDNFSDYSKGAVDSANLATDRGLKELAKADSEFAKFVYQMAQAQGRTLDEYVKGKQADKNGKGGFEGAWKRYGFKEIELPTGGVVIGGSPESKIRYLKDQKDALSDFVFTRTWDMASLKALDYLYKRSGLTPDQAKEIVSATGKLKSEYLKYWEKRGKGFTAADDAGSYDFIVGQMTGVRKQIIADATQRGQSVQEVVDFYDGALLSSIMNGHGDREGQTSFQRVGFEVAGPRMTTLFNQFYGETFEKLRGKALDVDTPSLIVNDVAKNIQLGNISPTQEDVITHSRILFRGNVKDVALDKKQQQLLDKLVEISKSWDKVTADDLMNYLRREYGVAQPSDLVIHDIEGLLARLESWKKGPGWIADFLGRKNLDEKGFPVKNYHSLMFIPTLADDLKREYLTFHTVNLWEKDGTLRKDYKDVLRPLKHFNRETGVLETVYAEQAIPMNELDRLMQLAGQKESRLSEVAAVAFKEHDRLVGWIARGITPVDGKKDVVDDMRRYSIQRRETNAAEKKYLASVGNDAISKEAREELERTKNAKIAALKDMDEVFRTNAARKFYVVKQGSSVVMNGREVFDAIDTSLDEFTTSYAHEKLIRLSDDWKARNVVIKNGIVDVPNSFGPMIKYFDRESLKEHEHELTYDNVRFADYYDALYTQAKDEAAALTLPTLRMLTTLEYGPIGEHSKLFPELKVLDRKGQRQWIAGYLKARRNPEVLASRGEHIKSKLDVESFKRAELDIATEALIKEKTLSSGNAIADYLFGTETTVSQRKDPHRPASIRERLYGSDRYNQEENDQALLHGRLSPFEYIFKMKEHVNPFRETGKLDGYWPHMDYARKTVLAWQADATRKVLERVGLTDVSQIADHPNAVELQNRINRINLAVVHALAEDRSPDAMLNTASAEGIVTNQISRSEKHLQDLGGGRRSGNMLHREHDMPGYSTELEVLGKYVSKMQTATYNNFAAFQAKRVIRSFERNDRMGKFTADWSFMLRSYMRGTMGYPSTFPEEVLNSKTLNIKSMPFYLTSDEFMFQNGTIANKFAKTVFGKEFETLKDKDKLAQMMRSFSSLEGKYEMTTLLFHSKTAVTNVLSGTVNNWVWTGGRFIYDARQLKVWRKINPEWQTMADVHKWVASTGAIEDFIINEGNVLARTQGPQFKKFVDDAVQKMRKNTDMADSTLYELAKKHNIPENIVKASGFFMRSTERYLRSYAFMSSYLQARSMMEPMRLDYDNDYLVNIGKKGIAASQFLYSNVTRPLFAGTNLGRVMTRFKLWSWSSVKFRREVYTMARDHGFLPNSPESKRFERLVTADLFVVGLASLLPMSIFGGALPAPFSYFKDLANWMFGNSKERERAYFSQSTGVPAALAPLNVLFPPIARLPKGIYDLPNTFNVMYGGEFSRIGEFTTYSLMPFGRMTKDLLKVYENPGLAPQALGGVPLHK